MATVQTELPAGTEGLGEPSPFRLSAEAFFRGVELGVFPGEARVYLWNGVLYEKMAKKIAHAATNETARTALLAALPPGWSLWGENPILVDDFTAPLPDLAVVRGTARDYFTRGSVPRAGEIGVVIELSDATLRTDLTKSLAKYAGAGLLIYWAINLVAWRVEVYSSPVVENEVSAYSSRQTFEPGQEVPLVLDGIEVARVAVSALLPAEKAR
jgi:Uma2 family endonuclease